MSIIQHRIFRIGALVALAGAASVAGGCVREVLSGEDPQAKAGRLTGKNSKDELVIQLPWMQLPQPRLLLDDKLVRTEAVFNRGMDGVTHFVLRTADGVSATVDGRAKRLKDDSMEFTYEVLSLPPKYMLDTAIEVKGSGPRPDVDLVVNGAPAKMAPGTDVAIVQLSRDAATRIVAVPRPQPAPEAPKTGNP